MTRRVPFWQTKTWRGIVQVAKGRSAGLLLFGDGPADVLAGLSPLAALVVVASAAAVIGGGGRQALGDLLTAAIMFMAMLVFSFEVARRWGRGAEWFRFATALCWCQWLGPPALFVLVLATSLLMVAGVPNQAAAWIGLGSLMAYGGWLHWFLAKHALQLSGLRALALVAVVGAATILLVSLPQLVAG